MTPSDPPVLPRVAAEVAELTAFVTVARARTVGRAARWLGRTQPSISARLASLERTWNTRLFRRVARGMELTPEGARLLGWLSWLQGPVLLPISRLVAASSAALAVVLRGGGK